MLLKIAVLFLIFMLVLGMVQKMLRPDRPNRSALDKFRCPTCRRINLSSSSAPCSRPDCGNR